MTLIRLPFRPADLSSNTADIDRFRQQSEHTAQARDTPNAHQPDKPEKTPTPAAAPVMEMAQPLIYPVTRHNAPYFGPSDMQRFSIRPVVPLGFADGKLPRGHEQFLKPLPP